MASLQTLAGDLVYQVLLRLSTRGDLKAFICACKGVYATFLEHPSSVLKSVVCREMEYFGRDERGLELAKQVAHLHARLGELVDGEPGDSETLGDEADSEYPPWRAMKMADIDRMLANHAVVKRLLRKFSVRCKDALHLYDTLTSEESARITKALYTFWKLQLLYQHRRMAMHSNHEAYGEYEACVKDLESLETYELVRLKELKAFLLMEVRALEIAGAQYWVLSGEYGLSKEGCRYHLLSIGLDNLENLHEVNFTAPPFSPSPAFQDKLWFAHALEETINSRGIEAPAEDPVHNLVLRKGTIIYKCQSCRRSVLDCSPPTFYNVTNADEIEPAWSLTDFPGWWFSRNPFEMDRVCRRILGRPATMTTDLLRDSTTIPLRIQALEEILHHATEKHAQIVKRQGGASGGSSDDDGGDESGSSGGSNRYGGKREYKWSPLDVLCASCFRPVLQNHFYAWWINERMSERVEPKAFREDCWYGKNCRTQRKLEHATKLNHCCPQMRVSSPLEFY